MRLGFGCENTTIEKGGRITDLDCLESRNTSIAFIFNHEN